MQAAVQTEWRTQCTFNSNITSASCSASGTGVHTLGGGWQARVPRPPTTTHGLPTPTGPHRLQLAVTPHLVLIHSMCPLPGPTHTCGGDPRPSAPCTHMGRCTSLKRRSGHWSMDPPPIRTHPANMSKPSTRPQPGRLSTKSRRAACVLWDSESHGLFSPPAPCAPAAAPSSEVEWWCWVGLLAIVSVDGPTRAACSSAGAASRATTRHHVAAAVPPAPLPAAKPFISAARWGRGSVLAGGLWRARTSGGKREGCCVSAPMGAGCTATNRACGAAAIATAFAAAARWDRGALMLGQVRASTRPDLAKGRPMLLDRKSVV